jgi:hypothetical protein
MFWWQDEEEQTFEAVSGIAVSVLETHSGVVYRVAPRQDTPELHELLHETVEKRLTREQIRNLPKRLTNPW